MKPFSLDAVLKYRQRLKDVARNRFQEAKNQFALTNAQYTKKKEEYLTLTSTVITLQAEGISITELIRYEDRKEFLQNEIKMLEAELKKKQEFVLRERKHLLLKSKEHHVLEQLKEKQNAQWRQFLNKKEAAMLDEIAVLYRNR